MKSMQMRLSGSGGQGIILLGVILAETAIASGANAIQSQSYGPEARGGASKCEVIISHDEIDFPKVQRPTLVLAMTQVAADKYARDLDKDCILILDDQIELSEDSGAGNVYRLPLLVTARDVVRKELTANIVAIGAINEILGLFDWEVLKTAIFHRIPKGTELLNQRAIEAGVDLVKNYVH